MTKQAVIDTNVLVALVDDRDKWHPQAQDLLSAFEARNVSLVYFDCVVNETITVLARRWEEQKRSGQFLSVLETLLKQVPDARIEWLSLETQRLYRDVVDLVRQTNGALNFHDALIALGCRELGLSLIVSFDEDFDGVFWLTRIKDAETVLRSIDLD